MRIEKKRRETPQREIRRALDDVRSANARRQARTAAPAPLRSGVRALVPALPRPLPWRRAATLENSLASKSGYAARRCIEINTQTPKNFSNTETHGVAPLAPPFRIESKEYDRICLRVRSDMSSSDMQTRWLNYGARQRERGGEREKRTNER